MIYKIVGFIKLTFITLSSFSGLMLSMVIDSNFTACK